MRELYMTRTMLVNFADDMDNGFEHFKNECEKTTEMINNEDVNKAMCDLSYAMYKFQETVNRAFINPFMSVFDNGIKSVTIEIPNSPEDFEEPTEDGEYKIKER